jgi:hypothetical protein
MAVSALLSTAMASDLLRTATESLLNRFCLTLLNYFRHLLSLSSLNMHLKKTESTPQHDSFKSIRCSSARTAKLNSLLRPKKSPLSLKAGRFISRWGWGA